VIKAIAQVISKVSEIRTSIYGAVEEQTASTSELVSDIRGLQRAAEETGQASSNLLRVSGHIDERTNERSKEFAEFSKII
jgi:methyl-accepting chemotaxis protein